MKLIDKRRYLPYRKRYLLSAAGVLLGPKYDMDTRLHIQIARWLDDHLLSWVAATFHKYQNIAEQNHNEGTKETE